MAENLRLDLSITEAMESRMNDEARYGNDGELLTRIESEARNFEGKVRHRAAPPLHETAGVKIVDEEV